jgi:50S ribosomal protein L16 3-hydroxylase
MTAHELLGMELDEFVENYWRKQPLLVKGGAHQWPSISEEQLLSAARTNSASGASSVREEPGLLAVEHVDGCDADLARAAAALARVLGAGRAWFEAFAAEPGRGVGAHCDYSDNFVLQQHGTKRWRLAPPSLLPADARRSAMLNEMSMTLRLEGFDPTHEIDLESGDMLYIPLLWLHEGVAATEGTRSLSFVIHPDPGLALLPILAWLLDADGPWREPLPADALDLRAHVDALLDRVSHPEFRRTVTERWLSMRRGTAAS